MVNHRRFQWDRLVHAGSERMASCLRSPAFISLLLVVCIDMGLRCVPIESLLPTQVGSAVEYRAILADIQTREGCDICLVGDSRMSEAIRLPQLRRELQGSSLAADRIANYGASLATADMVRVVSERVFKRGPVRVLVIGVTVEMFLAKPNHTLPYGLFLEPELQHVFGKRDVDQSQDQSQDQSDRGKPSRWLRNSSQMSLAWQAKLGSYWWAFRFRDRPKQWFRDRWRQWSPINRRSIGEELEKEVERRDSPLLGRNPIRQSEEPRRNLIHTPVERKDVERHIKNNIGNDHRSIRQETIQEIARLLEDCQRRGVLPILLEIPLPKELLKHYSLTRQRDFVEAMRKFEQEFSAEFLEWNDESEPLNGEDFLDFIHLNRQGATKFTQVFVRRLKTLVSPVPSKGESP